MKNHLEFWSEHPVISNFWLIMHTITAIAIIIWMAITAMIVACDWIYWEGANCKKFLCKLKERAVSLKTKYLCKSAIEEEA